MITEIAYQLISQYSGKLSFFDKWAGLVVPLKKMVDKTEKTFPVYINHVPNCNNSQLMDLLPSSDRKSVIYVEKIGDPVIEQIKTNYFLVNATIRIVCWYNLDKINGGLYLDDGVIINNILQNTPSKLADNLFDYSKGVKLFFKGSTSGASIFDKYSYNEVKTQFTTFPYGAVALDYEVSYAMVKCSDPLNPFEACGQQQGFDCNCPPPLVDPIVAFTQSEKDKLAGIEEGAEVNDPETDPIFNAWLVATPPAYPSDIPTDISELTDNTNIIPDTTSDLTNDSGFITLGDIPAETDPLSLHLDQTIPQAVVNGSPIMEGIQFDTTPSTSNTTEGLLRWNSTDGTLDLGMSGGDITQQIGQELFTKVRNDTGATISNGKVVYISGRTGVYPDVKLAKSDVESTSRVLGVATQDILNTGSKFGFITTMGYVRGIKTNYSGNGIWGTTWVAGDNLYVSKSVAGQLTNIEPAAPHHSDIVGSVGVVSANGSILVNIERHKTLEELTDVDGTALTTTGQFPTWDDTQKYFDFNHNISEFALTGDVPTDISELTDSTGIIPTDTNDLTNGAGYITLADVQADTNDKVKYAADDAAAGYLSTKVISGTGISLAEGTGGDVDKLKIINSAPDQVVSIAAGTNIDSVSGSYPNFTINASTQAGTTDEKVKYDVNDPTAGYVADKIVSGDGISVAEGTGAEENKLVITNTDKGSDVDLSGLLDETAHDLLDHTGLTGIPSIAGLLDETAHDLLDHTGLTGIHAQNTDTGTSSNTFTIDSDSTTGKIIIDVALDAANKSLTITNEALTDNRIATFPNKSGTVAMISDIAAETDPIVGAITGIVKANGAGIISAATADTDYATPTLAKQFALDVNRYGFVSRLETNLSFDGVDTITLADKGSGWSYYRAGVKYTISGNKTIPCATPMVDGTLYYIYIDSALGTLISGSAWTLNDTKVPVCTLKWDSTLTPKFVLADERHTCKIDRAYHREHHFADGTETRSPGTLGGLVAASDTDTDKVFSLTDASIFDEDLFFDIFDLAKPDGNTDVYPIVYRTGASSYKWVLSDMPFKYTDTAGTNPYGFIEYDLNGTSTASIANRFVNTYVFVSNSVANNETDPEITTSNMRIMILQGRGSYTTSALAIAERLVISGGFPVAEGVGIYQITWATTNRPDTVKGRCRYVSTQSINTNVTLSAVALDYLHNNLLGLDGGAINEYYHLTLAQHTIATNAADTDNDGYLTQTDWDTFNGKQNALTFGIADTNAVKIDHNAVADNDYAKFTANGVEGRSYSEVLSDIGAQPAGTYSTDIHANITALNAVSGTNTGDNAANTSIAATKLDDFATPDDNTDLNANTTNHGLAPKVVAPASGNLSVLGVTNGETVRAEKLLLDSTAPSTQAFGDSAAAGSSLKAARVDHKHAMPSGLTSANITQTITNGVTDKAPSEDAVYDALAGKQATLVSQSNIKSVNGTTLLGSGDLTITAGADMWTALTGAYASTTTFTFTGVDKDVKLIQHSLFTCTDSAGTTRRIGYIKSAVNNSGTITATVVTDTNLAANDKDFKVAYNRKVTDYQFLITIPGECIADASYSQGMFLTNLPADSYLLPVNAAVRTAAAGTGAALTFNVYKNTTALFTAAPDLATNATLIDQRPNTNTLSAAETISLRIMSSAGATNKAADFQAKLFIIPTLIYTAF